MLAEQEIAIQHHELISMLGKLNDAVKNLQPREDVYRIIEEVIAFTRMHFATEEQFMVQSAYPEAAAHIERHEQLIQDALHLKAKLDYVGEELFTEWFNHWPFSRVLAHIQYADQHFEEHLAKQRNGS